MPKSRKNQRGFALVESLLIILVLAVIGFGGYYVWHTQHDKTKTATTSSKTTSSSPSSQKYLTISQWNVKLPLSNTISGAYYAIDSSTDNSTGVAYSQVSLFDSKIDNLKNTNGVSCKDSTFPILIISRIADKDVAVENNNLVEQPAYATVNNIPGYAFSGVGFHQAAPGCSILNPTSTAPAQYDQSILNMYNADKQAFGDAYSGMRTE